MLRMSNGYFYIKTLNVNYNCILLFNFIKFSDIDEFRNAFQQGCPKFLSPTSVAFYNGHNLAKV